MAHDAVHYLAAVLESIIAAVFEARIAGLTHVGTHPAVIPEIRGRAGVPGSTNTATP
jgi:proline racemase